MTDMDSINTKAVTTSMNGEHLPPIPAITRQRTSTDTLHDTSDSGKAHEHAHTSQAPWLARVPVSVLGVFPGFASQALLFKNIGNTTWMDVPKLPVIILWFLAIAIASCAMLVYLCKAYRYPRIVKWELAHPLRHNDFFLLLIGTYITCLAFPQEYLGKPNMQVPFWILGALHLVGCYVVYGDWWVPEHRNERGMSYRDAEPSYLFTLVTWFLAATLGADAGYLELARALFWIGTFYWMILYVSLWQNIARALAHMSSSGTTPQLFLTMAPSAVACIAWAHMGRAAKALNPSTPSIVEQTAGNSGAGDVFDAVGRFFFFNSAAAAILVITRFWRSYRTAIVRRAFLPWWATTFPMVALAIATLEYGQVVSTPFIHVITWITCALAWIVFLCVCAWNAYGFITWTLWKDPLLEKEWDKLAGGSSAQEMEEIKVEGDNH